MTVYKHDRSLLMREASVTTYLFHLRQVSGRSVEMEMDSSSWLLWHLEPCSFRPESGLTPRLSNHTRISHYTRFCMTVKRSCLATTVVSSRIVIGFLFSRAMWLVWQCRILVVTVTAPCPCRVSGIWLDEKCVPCRDRHAYLIYDWPTPCRDHLCNECFSQSYESFSICCIDLLPLTPKLQSSIFSLSSGPLAMVTWWQTSMLWWGTSGFPPME